MRRGEITSQLDGLGFSREPGFRSSIQHPLVRQTKLLTQHEWCNIKPILIKVIQDFPAKVIQYERNERFRALNICFMSRYDDLCEEVQEETNRTLMPVDDFLASPAARTVNGLIYFSLPEMDEEDIFPAYIRDLRTHLDRLSGEWVRQKAKELKQSIHQSADKGYASYSDLRKNVFQCKACSKFFWVPQVYMHQCTKDDEEGTIEDKDKWPTDWKYPYNPSKMYPRFRIWNAKRFRWHASATMCAKKAMKLCGAKTVEELGKINPEVECMHKDCYGEGKNQHLVKWRDVKPCNFPPSPVHAISAVDKRETRKSRGLRRPG
ncbi:hypothetical protein E1B28_003823 [Marasmius oreades]|uniref:Uncharacterized protein n=1 Tax=Marasmius oreades TaxID=181124 RepID=A0A9P7UXB6_9AGAR|nr:uncharacterized protein E1B28_003823 [Marasmius oreades]KAG7096379.1 hypothetical protein E1B28_003823 [Marasmius oreades]